MPKGHGDHSFSPDDANASQSAKEGETEKPKHRHLSKVMSILKGNTKAAVETKLAVDHVRAATGSNKAQGHLGVLPKKKNLIYAGPSEFKARFKGEKGWLCITNTAESTTATSNSSEQRLVFMTEEPSKIDASDKNKTRWSISVQDIRRLKRATAFVKKPAEMAADWSENTELLGSLEIDDGEGHTWRFTAIPERDELFNRLVALGNQRWENM